MLFESVKQNIIDRRTTKPETMNGRIIDDPEILELLELANWAPTHGYTEPWRFVVFSGDGLTAISNFHADLYKREMEAKDQKPVKYDKILNRTSKISHLVAICLKRGENPKIPANEEHASVAIAAQHIWLGAAAKDIACYWGSGGMTYHPEMRSYLGLENDQDKVLGFLYLGYSDCSPLKGKRLTSIKEKITWIKD